MTFTQNVLGTKWVKGPLRRVSQISLQIIRLRHEHRPFLFFEFRAFVIILPASAILSLGLRISFVIGVLKFGIDTRGQRRHRAALVPVPCYLLIYKWTPLLRCFALCKLLPLSGILFLVITYILTQFPSFP